MATQISKKSRLNKTERSGLGLQNRTDRDLLLSIAHERSKKSFREFYARHERHYYNLSFRITQSTDLAAEATQEAMLKIWNSAASFNPDGSAYGWATRIATNEGLALLRRRKNRREVSHEDGISRSKTDEPLPAESCEKDELQRSLRTLLQALPPLDQRLLALYFGSGLSQDDMAKILQMQQSKISKLLKNLLGKLRSDLKQAGFGSAMVCVYLKNPNSWRTWLHCIEAPVSIQTNVMNRILVQKSGLPLLNANHVIFDLIWIPVWAAFLAFAVPLYSFNSFTPSLKMTTASSASAVKPIKRLKKIWNFDAPNDTEGLTFFNPAPLHRAKGGWKDSGCLYFKSMGQKLAVKFPLPNLPVKITCRMKFEFTNDLDTVWQVKGSWQQASYWIYFTGFEAPKYFLDKATWTTYTFYVTPKSVDLWCLRPEWKKPKRTALLLAKRTKEAAFFLSHKGPILMDELKIEEVSMDEIPDLSDFATTFNSVQSHMTPDQWHPIPELKKYQRDIKRPIKMRWYPPGTKANFDHN